MYFLKSLYFVRALAKICEIQIKNNNTFLKYYYTLINEIRLNNDIKCFRKNYVILISQFTKHNNVSICCIVFFFFFFLNFQSIVWLYNSVHSLNVPHRCKTVEYVGKHVNVLQEQLIQIEIKNKYWWKLMS